ncbi:alpha/beta hydrolase family protein [Adhaeribacter soli]|uniref:Prolyl oligopeptidase family serine peptidase n=1 Tax=Adhaeribacter soli TaxID=2607655 RepID=A0A5N1ILM2_9BACT|nr:prolyl oligopeptidase family serine peptidase [Adhaeribacter soli]KAA9327367.1 prolyl oligopeptidase family serine peptidase [Adhaeribacter soli]
MSSNLFIRIIFLPFLLFNITFAFAQKHKPEDFGYRFVQTLYKKDTVNLVIVSKKGEAMKKKPVILFEKGSLPIPLIIEDDRGFFPIMPFDTKIFTEDYHLVFISKPGVPVRYPAHELSPRMEYNDPKTGLVPQFYQERNHLDYYVSRDVQILKFLKKQPWVDKNKMVIAGHSEGGTIMAKLATVSKDVTHVISSGQNPFGQMATIMAQTRAYDDSAGTYANAQFEFWEKLVNKSPDIPFPAGYNLEQQYRYQYGFSLPAIDYFKRIKVPVLVSYGTKDNCALYNDYMRITMIREQKKNFTFLPYIGLEHNYFKLDEQGKAIPDNVGWNNAAKDWKAWLEKQ